MAASSVPGVRYCPAGGSSCSAGSYGASHGAAAATATSTAAMPAPHARADERDRRLSRGTLGMADPRIDQSVDHVGEEIAEDDDGGAQRHRAEDQRVIAGEDGVEGELAETGPGEDDLGDQRAGEQGRQRQGEELDPRHGGV